MASVIYRDGLWIKKDNGSESVLVPKPISAITAVGAGQSVIAAVTGKDLYILWLFAQTGGAAGAANGSYQLKSGGTAITAFFLAPKNTDAAFPLFPPVAGAWYWKTLATGDAITADVGTTGVNISGAYLEV